MTGTARHSIEQLERLFADALMSDSFERLGARRGIWDVSRDCESPVPVVLHSRATESIAVAMGRRPRNPGIELTLLTACRKCPTCLRKRSRLWTFRAIEEIKSSSRTWFGTLTIQPSEHYRIDERAATTISRDFWKLPEGKKFEARVREVSKEVTKYLKRLREDADTSFRYLLVSEMHDGPETSPIMRGRPHVHVFIHELIGHAPLKKAVLERQWKLGFSSWKIADINTAWYISKYLTKANDGRIRASLGYGNN